ncbi:MAG: hypothetical protein ACLGGW_00475, partial [Gammaproteobacteria bacterium]
MKPNTALNTALSVSKIGVYVVLLLSLGACAQLKPLLDKASFREKLKAPEITVGDQQQSKRTLPIERLPEDTFWVKPSTSGGSLPAVQVSNLSVTERGLFDVLQIVFSN